MRKEQDRPKSPSPGFIMKSNRIVDSGLLAQMKGSENKVYDAILRHKNKNSMQSFPSLLRLSAECGLSRGTVQRAIKALIKCGLISKHRFLSGRKFKLVFTVPFDPPLRVPMKPNKLAYWKGISRTKDGKFAAKPKNDSGTIKPDFSNDFNKPKITAYNKTLTIHEQYLNQSDPKLSTSTSTPASNNSEGAEGEKRNKLPIIGQDIIRDLLERWGEKKLRAYMEAKNYPLYILDDVIKKLQLGGMESAEKVET